MKNRPSFDYSIYIREFLDVFPDENGQYPWQVIHRIQSILERRMQGLSSAYDIQGNVAIHKTAEIEEHVILKGPVIIGENCFIAAHCYLRNGVCLNDRVSLGPGCEVKASFIFSESSLAHFNYAGDSIIGSQVNLEAGAVVANCFNERTTKEVEVILPGERIQTGVDKFGALIGDRVKIGANAVLSPGTVLPPGSVVGRLQLVEQFRVSR